MLEDPRVYELLLLRLAGGLSAALVAQGLTVGEFAATLAGRFQLNSSPPDPDEVARWTSRLRRILCGSEEGVLSLRHLALIEDALGFDVWSITATV